MMVFEPFFEVKGQLMNDVVSHFYSKEQVYTNDKKECYFLNYLFKIIERIPSGFISLNPGAIRL